jgi:hypothetical protein
MRLWNGGWLLVGALVLGCAGAEPKGEGAKVEAPASDVRPVALTQAPTEKDPLAIDSLTLSGDTLVAEVHHGGGCAEHSYGLEWDGSFMESAPVQVMLVFNHDAHGDRCKALVSASPKFDLTPLKKRWREAYRQEHGVIIIRAKGAEHSVRYEF